MKPTIAFLPLLCLLTTCVEINGGAVEVSWVIRSDMGSAITECACASPAIAIVRLELLGMGGGVDGDQPCAGNAQCDFPCARQTGSTPFNIKETHGTGGYLVSVKAVGVDGIPLDGVKAPAPILRQVTRGQPTELESMQLIANCAMECQMNSSGVCASP